MPEPAVTRRVAHRGRLRNRHCDSTAVASAVDHCAPLRLAPLPALMNSRLFILIAAAVLGFGAAARADKKIVLAAGPATAGRTRALRRLHALLASKLNQQPGFKAEVHRNGWPESDTAFDGADAVFIYCDGGDNHPAIRPERLRKLGELMAKGVGLGTCHYGVEVPKGDPGDAWLKWTGGYFETFWSVNPHWDAEFTRLPSHPITRGVKPFKIRDEWYYHASQAAGVTPS
jgi:hypothetical protein